MDLDTFFDELDEIIASLPMPGNADGLEIEDTEAECEVLQ